MQKILLISLFLFGMSTRIPDEDMEPTIQDLFPQTDPIYCGKFWVSTDDPNVWIEMDDLDIFGVQDGWYFS